MDHIVMSVWAVILGKWTWVYLRTLVVEMFDRKTPETLFDHARHDAENQKLAQRMLLFAVAWTAWIWIFREQIHEIKSFVL